MRRPVAMVAAGGALAALGLVLVRRRLGRLRLRRGLAALRLAARGGVRYTRSAPALFASADRNRERLRNDLALRTAEETDALAARLPLDRLWPGDHDSPISPARGEHRGEHLDEIEAALRARS